MCLMVSWYECCMPSDALSTSSPLRSIGHDEKVNATKHLLHIFQRGLFCPGCGGPGRRSSRCMPTNLAPFTWEVVCWLEQLFAVTVQNSPRGVECQQPLAVFYAKRNSLTVIFFVLRPAPHFYNKGIRQ